MAPPPDPIQDSAPSAESQENPISKILVFIAMQAEALPLVNKFNLSEDEASLFPKGVPWIRYHGVYKDLQINIVIPGKDAVFGIDSVGTVSAALGTFAAVQALNPDIVLNVGTAGGFKVKGASVGDVYLATNVAFHDRRIPIPIFDQYGVRARPTFPTPNLIKELELKVGNLSTGDSLDMSSEDEKLIRANDSTIKDMEGAAVAYVTDLFSVPTIFLKAITDVVDGEKPTTEEFLENLSAVTLAMEETVTKVVDFINGKMLSEL
uniref:TSA: Wollemia nobilis Ref_Wollemi_Transcript_9073_1355 transcribed RNA sequence n=1 Tax=Wollemia nobilis TaxID=56998 RepID=A0A0C9QUC7_9CONI